jgi:hypothetical protein
MNSLIFLKNQKYYTRIRRQNTCHFFKPGCYKHIKTKDIKKNHLLSQIRFFKSKQKIENWFHLFSLFKMVYKN